MNLIEQTPGKKCPNCRSPVNETSSFCTSCGSKLIPNDTTRSAVDALREVVESTATLVSQIGISEGKGQVVFYQKGGVEIGRIPFQDFLDGKTVAAQGGINKLIDFAGEKVNLVVSMVVNGVRHLKTYKINQVDYNQAVKAIKLLGNQVQATQESAQTITPLPNLEEATLDNQFIPETQRAVVKQHVDGELLTYDPGTGKIADFVKQQVSLFEDRQMHPFDLYVPQGMANLLKDAKLYNLPTTSSLYPKLADEEEFNVFGHKIPKASLIESLSGKKELYMFRQKAAFERLIPGGSLTHNIFIPIHTKDNKVVIFQINQIELANLLDEYSAEIDNPMERVLAYKGLQTTQYELSKEVSEGGIYKQEQVKAIEVVGMILTRAGDTKVEVQGATTRGERRVNQDVLSIHLVLLADGTEITILRIYDGMGGHGNGEKASKKAAENEINYLTSLGLDQIDKIKSDAQSKGISFEVALMDETIKNVAQTTIPQIPHGAGTTVTGGWIVNHKFVAGSRGDSRTYVMRDGVPFLKTTDHSLIANLIAAGQVTPEQALTHPQRSVIFKTALDAGKENIIANSPLQRVVFDIAEIPLQTGDVILSMCDGVVGGLDQQRQNPDQVMSQLSLRRNQDHLALQAVDQFAKGSGDNDTFLYARYSKI